MLNRRILTQITEYSDQAELFQISLQSGEKFSFNHELEIIFIILKVSTSIITRGKYKEALSLAHLKKGHTDDE